MNENCIHPFSHYFASPSINLVFSFCYLFFNNSSSQTNLPYLFIWLLLLSPSLVCAFIFLYLFFPPSFPNLSLPFWSHTSPPTLHPILISYLQCSPERKQCSWYRYCSREQTCTVFVCAHIGTHSPFHHCRCCIKIS